jgi:uncharacterized protein (DUF1919 family)
MAGIFPGYERAMFFMLGFTNNNPEIRYYLLPDIYLDYGRAMRFILVF